MIFKSNFPGSPDVAVVISDASVDYTSIRDIEVHFNSNSHDLAILNFVGLIPSAITDYTGRPVYISIAHGTEQINEFYGYVAYIEPEMITRQGLINNSPVQVAKVVCLGASYDMKSTHNMIWTSVTIPQLVEKIADKYRYSYSVPNDNFVFPRIVQHEESDWNVLNQACLSLGYSLVVNGTHIHIYDPLKAITRKMPYAELTTVRGSAGNMAFKPGNIMEFRGSFGDVTPDGSSNTYEYQSLDNEGNLIVVGETDLDNISFGETVTPRFKDVITTNATSLEVLRKYANSKKRTIYPYHADVVVTGVPEIGPGSVVKVTGYNSQFDGYWLVESACHKVSRSNFITDLHLITDAKNTVEPTLINQDAYKEPPNSILANDRWVAEKEFVNVYN